MAAIPAYRVFAQWNVDVGGHCVSAASGIIAAVVAAMMGVMVLRESAN
jgi:hypothetical protein